MLSRILLALTLAAPITVLAQYATIGPNGQVAPAGSTVVVVGNGGGPILSTPSVTFGTPQSTAGISLSDHAGISNATPTNPAIPSTSESYPVYSNTNTAGMGVQPATTEGVAAAPASANTGRMINDIEPSSFAGSAYVSGAPAVTVAGTVARPGNTASLGEVAAKYKAARPQNIRTYTNADAQRLSDSMDVHGASVTPVSASNTAPATMTSPATTQPSSMAAGAPVASNGRPSPGTPAVSTQSGQMAQTSQSQSSQAAAQNERQSATTPQVSQKNNAQSNGEEDNTRLPASSTLLPLFGVLGLASGAAGLWLKKHRG
jgi:septum formation inhibitor MinC